MESGPSPAGPDQDFAPEVLEVAPNRSRGQRLVTVGVIALVVAVVGGLLAWQFWPRPVAPLTLAELEGVYAGMVRGDGTNDASVLPRPKDDDRRDVAPAECQPLFETTEFARFPAAALDGVGTYWMANQVGGSLFSFRFDDSDAARRAYQQVEAALTACDGRDVDVTQRRNRTVQMQRTDVSGSPGAPEQLGYLYETGASNRFAVQVLRYENLVTWQFRYESANGDYVSTPAQQLMDSFVLQTQSVIELRA